MIVDPKTNLEYLDYLSARLTEFIATFDEFMTFHVENIGPTAMARGVAPAVFTMDGADGERVANLTTELNRLAGTLMDLSEVANIYMGVEGAGMIDPFTNWGTITQPKPLLEASNVRGCALQAAGRLEGLRARAAALAAPALDPVRLHPLVWAAAQRLWNDGHLRQAVAAAGEAVNSQMKLLTARNDAGDTNLWQQAFSERPPEPGKPRLRWPGDPSDQDVKTMNDGLRQFAPGTNMVIRNPATHAGASLTEQDALERLAVLSLLARLVDGCSVERAASDDSAESAV